MLVTLPVKSTETEEEGKNRMMLVDLATRQDEIPTSSLTNLTQTPKRVLLNHYITWNTDRHGLKADATYLVTSVYSLQNCDLDLDRASLSAKVLCSGIILGMFIWFFFDFVEAGSCQPLLPALRGSNYQHVDHW
jgi:hypothetical protein